MNSKRLFAWILLISVNILLVFNLIFAGVAALVLIQAPPSEGLILFVAIMVFCGFFSVFCFLIDFYAYMNGLESLVKTRRS